MRTKDAPKWKPANEVLEHLEIQVTGMTCSHCTAAVARAIRECEGVRKVEVDLKTGRATVEGLGVKRQKLLEAIQSLGYEATI
jgi:copper chaperone